MPDYATTERLRRRRHKREVAIAALELGPLVRSGNHEHSSYLATGGKRLFSTATIASLVEDGLAVYVGNGVMSCRMMREAAARLEASSEVKNKDETK